MPLSRITGTAQTAFGGKSSDPYLRQTVNNMSLIKSTDKGLTWARGVKANYNRPLWTSPKFSTAAFIKYGPNGSATTQDDQDKYVYAISNDGYWNCGCHFYLGRVLRSKIVDLKAADWQYYSHGNWSGRIGNVTPIAGFPNGQMKCTMGSPIWLAGIRKYVTVTWYDPGTTAKWHYPENVTFAFYQADHPWGPWSYVGEKSCCDFIGDTKQRISRWYGPSLSPRFITANPDGSVTAILTFSGQLWTDTPASLYRNNSCPVTFYTTPQLKEVKTLNDTDGTYSGKWIYQPHRGVGDYKDDVHVTTKSGAYVDLAFTGRGIEVLSEKHRDMGKVEVLIDGVSQGTFNLYQDPMPRLYQVECYRNMNLTSGAHTVRVVNRAPDGTFCLIDGFRVYGGTDFDSNTSYMIVNRVNGKALGCRGNTPQDTQVQQLPVDANPGLQWKIQSMAKAITRSPTGLPASFWAPSPARPADPQFSRWPAINIPIRSGRSRLSATGRSQSSFAPLVWRSKDVKTIIPASRPSNRFTSEEIFKSGKSSGLPDLGQCRQSEKDEI